MSLLVQLYLSDELDVDGLKEHLEDQIDDVMDELEDRLMSFWKNTADQNLNTTKEPYKSGLSSDKLENGIEFSLDGFLPNAVELGYEGGDMKDRLLAGRNKRVIPIMGQYRTVSVNSKPTSWIHPGIKARLFHELVFDNAEEIARELFMEKLSNK